jgi:hypothetical protein
MAPLMAPRYTATHSSAGAPNARDRASPVKDPKEARRLDAILKASGRTIFGTVI